MYYNFNYIEEKRLFFAPVYMVYTCFHKCSSLCYGGYRQCSREWRSWYYLKDIHDLHLTCNSSCGLDWHEDCFSNLYMDSVLFRNIKGKLHTPTPKLPVPRETCIFTWYILEKKNLFYSCFSIKENVFSLDILITREVSYNHTDVDLSWIQISRRKRIIRSENN